LIKEDQFQPDKWFSQTAVWRFHPNHIDYICYHYELLLAGKWPEKISGYIDSPLDGKGPIQPHAYFENVIQLIAEFHWRIDQCGDDGEDFQSYKLDMILLEEEARGRSRKQIVRGRGLDQIERNCKCVRDYIKGVSKNGLNRRQQTYDSFKQQWWPGYADWREKYRIASSSRNPFVK